MGNSHKPGPFWSSADTVARFFHVKSFDLSMEVIASSHIILHAVQKKEEIKELPAKFQIT